MAEVWDGVHRGTGTPVAVKVLTTAYALEPEYVAHFRDEARAMAGLDHPGIIVVLDFGEVGLEEARRSEGVLVAGSPYLVLERASGGSLVPWTSQDHRPMTWPELRGTLGGLLDALAHAHARGLVHRDIKPANVLLPGPEDPRPGPKLTDFGLVHIAEQVKRPDNTTRARGTVYYMAPEQVRGRWRDYGPWTDLYALGCLAFELASGRRPFSGGSFFEVMLAHVAEPPPAFEPRIAVPDGLSAWLDRALDKEPRRRFARAAEAAEALLRLDDAGREPLPLRWQRPSEGSSAVGLARAGLGLFGLREIGVVDREAERDVLWAALRRAAEERRVQAVLLEGPAGMGKSRLAEWLCQRAHEVGVASVHKAVHGPIPGPGDGLGPMLGRALSCLGLPRHRLEERVRDQLAAAGETDEEEGRSLVALLAPPRDGEDLEGTTVRFGDPRERWALVRRVLARDCRERAAVVWLEDVPWGLDALGFSVDLLTARSSDDLPLLLILTADTDALAEAPEARELLGKLADHCRRLEVGPLPESYREELVRRLLQLEPGLVRQVTARTEGHPLLVRQLVGDWVQRGLLEEGPDGFRLRRGVQAALPDDIHAVWTARIDRAVEGQPDSAGVALELAAVLGQEVSWPEWEEVCRRAEVTAELEQSYRTLLGLLEPLLAERLVCGGGVGAGVRWWFAHGMLRESLERRAAEAGRAAGHHRLCAGLLADRGGPRAAERAAAHLLAAGDREQALAPLAVAAEERLAVGALAEAERLVARLEQATAAVRVPPEDERWGRAWLLRAELCSRRSAYQEVGEWAEQAHGAARTHGWEEVEVAALRLLGQAARETGDPARAREWLQEAEERAAARRDT